LGLHGRMVVQDDAEARLGLGMRVSSSFTYVHPFTYSQETHCCCKCCGVAFIVGILL